MNTNLVPYSIDAKMIIECYQCGEHKPAGNSYQYEDCDYCADCWTQKTEEEGLCESCANPLEAITEDTHPDGLGYYQFVEFKPCQHCKNEGGL